MSILKVWDEASQSYQEFPAIKGEPGKTPVKGEDYFTEADIQECAEAAAELVDIPTNVSAFTNDAGYLTEIDKNKIIEEVLASLPAAEGVRY